jgi:hypothetical protein
MLQELVEEVERFLNEVAQEVDEAVDALLEATEEIAEQWQSKLETEIEPKIDEFFAPFLDALLGIETAIGTAVEETTRPVVNTVEPMINEHSACVGCRNYHGQVYGGDMLVCGMHPYGWDGEKCPDWESVWPSP